LIEASIDPRGMSRFFEKLKRQMANSGMATMENSLSLVNTHPTSQERIDRLAEKWKELPKKSGFDDLGQ
jgi:predicted Zn-dependent protease